jgi:hypothetical protein
VSVLVSLAFETACIEKRIGAQASRKLYSLMDLARCCIWVRYAATHFLDFKSSASAIPPPGQGS